MHRASTMVDVVIKPSPGMERTNLVAMVRRCLLVVGTLVSISVFPVALQAQSGLVAAWSFNEGTGTTVADASRNNNTDTITGSTWTTLGPYGNALSFNCVSNLVLVNSSASLNLTTGMTVSAWVFPTTNQSGWRTIVQKETDAYFLH